MERKIILEVKEIHPLTADKVRITEEAMMKLDEIRRETGLSAKYIASQLIVQGSEMTEIRKVK